MEIQYYTKHVYGRDKKYIKDKEQAKAISKLTGKKTIDNSDMDAMEYLGHTFAHVLNHKI